MPTPFEPQDLLQVFLKKNNLCSISGVSYLWLVFVWHSRALQGKLELSTVLHVTLIGRNLLC